MLKRIASEERGLVLVTGTTGSGKSTTLAAMIDYINATRAAHIMTVEDPIEYLHRDHHSIVNQREVAVDTQSFSHALRSALRQDPDVILVGEMRDFETVETALLAAETGHLVFSTLHTLDATETINRIIAVFPPHQQRQVRIQLASVLKAAISQRLLPRADGAGRVAGGRGHGLDRRSSATRSSTRTRPRMIHGAIAAGTSQYGMQTFDQSIFSLYQQGFVTLEEALRWASNVDEFKLKVQGISTTTDMARDEMAKRPAHAAAARRRSPASVDRPSAHTEGLKLLARRELSVEGGPRPPRAIAATPPTTSTRRSRGCSRAAPSTTAASPGRTRARRSRSKDAAGSASSASCCTWASDSDVAAEALGEVFGELDERALIDAAIRKKLRGRPALDDQRRARPALSISHAAGLLARRRRRGAAEIPHRAARRSGLSIIMRSRDIRRSFLEYFQQQRPHHRAELVARARTTTRRCSSPTPA